MKQKLEKFKKWKYREKMYRVIKWLFWILIFLYAIQGIVQICIEGGGVFALISIIIIVMLIIVFLGENSRFSKFLLFNDNAWGLGIIILIMITIGSTLKMGLATSVGTNLRQECKTLSDTSGRYCWVTDIIIGNPFNIGDVMFYEYESEFQISNEFYNDYITVVFDYETRIGEEKMMQDEDVKFLTKKIMSNVTSGPGASLKEQNIVIARLSRILKRYGISEVKSWKRDFKNIPQP